MDRRSYLAAKTEALNSGARTCDQPANHVNFELGCSALAPDGKTLAHIDEAGGVTLMQLGASIEPTRLAWRLPNPTQIAVTTGARLIAVGARGGPLYLLQPGTSRDPSVLGGSTNEVTALRFSDDGKVLAVATDEGLIRLWNTTKGGWYCSLHCKAKPWHWLFP